MKNIIWRNQASGILGVIVIVLTLLQGFPEVIESSLFIILGFLIAMFGFMTSYTLKKEIKAMKVNSKKDLPESETKTENQTLNQVEDFDINNN